jgi:hypothetical protein
MAAACGASTFDMIKISSGHFLLESSPRGAIKLDPFGAVKAGKSDRRANGGAGGNAVLHKFCVEVC